MKYLNYLRGRTGDPPYIRIYSKVSKMNIRVVLSDLFIVQHATLVIIVLMFFMQETHLKQSFVRIAISAYKSSCIPVRGRIKETARVNNLVIPQCAGWITSYPLIHWLHDTNVKYKALKLGDNSETILGIV